MRTPDGTPTIYPIQQGPITSSQVEDAINISLGPGKAASSLRVMAETLMHCRDTLRMYERHLQAKVLAEAQQAWSKNRPSHEGHWWWRPAPDWDAMVAWVCLMDGVLVIYRPAHPGASLLSMVDGEWQGPIRPQEAQQ